MKERPILFSAPMVRAILEGRKTMTRRVVNPFAPRIGTDAVPPDVVVERDGFAHRGSPYGQPGDRLWVKETWRVTNRWDHLPPRDLPFDRGMTIAYAAGGSRAHDDDAMYSNDDSYSPWDAGWMGKTRVSIHMPRAASRLTLEITGVRVERLQNITEADAIAEGILRDGEGWRGAPDLPWFASPIGAFRSLWESIHGAGSWYANPFVWVVEFRRITKAYEEAIRA